MLVCLWALQASAAAASPAADWEAVEGGWRALVSLPSAPYPYGRAPYTDDRVWIFVPEGYTPQRLRAVVHIHGYHGRVEALVPAQQLEAQLVQSGRDAVLVVPQGPRDAADMALGRLERPGGLRALLEDVAGLLQARGWLRPQAPPGPVVLSAHSGGYRGVANILQHTDLPVQAVFLFDALYSHGPVFAQAAASGAVLRSSWTRTGGTARQNRALARLLRGQGVEVGQAASAWGLERQAATVTQVSAPHAACVERGWAMASWLETSGLPARPEVAPWIHAALWRSPRQVWLSWRARRGQTRVEGSWDGRHWEVLHTAAPLEDSAVVPPRPWLRLVARTPRGDSPPSRRWPGTGRRWLVVDARGPMDPGDPARGALPLLLEALGAEASVVSQSFWEAQPEALEGFQGLLWWSDPAPWREPLGTAHRRRLEGWVASGKPLIWAAPSPEEGWAPSQPGGASLWEAAPLQARGRAALAALAELLGQAGDH